MVLCRGECREGKAVVFVLSMGDGMQSCCCFLKRECRGWNAVVFDCRVSVEDGMRLFFVFRGECCRGNGLVLLVVQGRV